VSLEEGLGISRFSERVMVVRGFSWVSVSGVSGRGSGYQSFLGQGLGIREINDGLGI
jgi:hypothetical protein